MKIYIFENNLDDIEFTAAVNTLRACGHYVEINPTGAVDAYRDDPIFVKDWIIIGESAASEAKIEFARILLEENFMRVGYVGTHCPDVLKKFIEPKKGILARFELFSDWNNLIYRHIWN